MNAALSMNLHLLIAASLYSFTWMTSSLGNELIPKEQLVHYVHHHVLVMCASRVSGMSIEEVGKMTEKTRIMFLGYPSLELFLRRYAGSVGDLERIEKVEAAKAGFSNSREYRNYICNELRKKMADQ